MEKSDSLGENWKPIPISNDTFSVIQPSILQHGKGRLQLLCRSRQKYIVQSWSSDNGNSWGPLTMTNLPNPNSGTDAVTLRSGLHVLVYNPIHTGRHKLAVALSSDGVTWKQVYSLEDQKQGEFSYPAVVEGNDSSILITYTHNRKNIKHVALRMK